VFVAFSNPSCDIMYAHIAISFYTIGTKGVYLHWVGIDLLARIGGTVFRVKIILFAIKATYEPGLKSQFFKSQSKITTDYQQFTRSYRR